MSPLQPANKDKKLPEGLIPEGVEPEKISEAELEEAKKESEQYHEQVEQAEEAVEEQAKELHETELDLESKEKLAQQTAPAADPQIKAVQNIMQANITDLYLELPPAEQKKFRAEGVRAAKEINGLLNQVKVNVKKVIELLKGWLSRLPGINKYFLEQESKIKLDKLLALKRQKEEQGMETTEQIGKK